MAHLIRFTLPAALLVAVLAPSRAHAEECASDADCGAGEQCVKGWSSPGCEDPSAGCPPTEPVPSEFGWCELQPISCATDADCPDFMRCMDEETVCWADASGATGCETPDPSKRTCRSASIECTTSADCPSSFECQTVPTPCPLMDCAPGTDCLPSECTETQNLCVPQTIACSTDENCPSAWSCEEVGGECAAPAPGMGGSAGSTDSTCAPILQCAPTGHSASSSGNPEQLTVKDDSESSENRSGGCTVAASGARSTSDGRLGLFAALGALLAFSARRRRS